MCGGVWPADGVEEYMVKPSEGLWQKLLKKGGRVRRIVGVVVVAVVLLWGSVGGARFAQAQFVWPFNPIPPPLCSGMPCSLCKGEVPFFLLWNTIWAEIGWKVMLWHGTFRPMLNDIRDQITGVTAAQTSMIGEFFNAQHQLDTQRVLRELHARAQKDYRPSFQMCEFGTLVGGMASANGQRDFNGAFMAQQALRRQTLAVGRAAAAGNIYDKAGRLALFKTRFCDPKDGNEAVTELCSTPAAAKTINKDVDYGRTVMTPYSLEVDFSNSDPGADAIDVLALGSNLYGHDLFERIPEDYLLKEAHQGKILDMRAVLAKRSVAQNSFNHVVGMKTAGGGDVGDYAKAALFPLGLDEAAAEALLGDNPSYYALMELVTKKIYQDPSFFTNLYDTPANVDRAGAALQAFSLMQNMDMFRSHLRSEMLLSVALELALEERQVMVQERLSEMEDDSGS